MWKCRRCGNLVVEEVKLVQAFRLDKNLKQNNKVATGGYGGEYADNNRLFVCTHCGTEQFNDIHKLAEWEEK
ncbi:hypothetical protein [Cetobacterium sp.]|uniref:hypothetical protein n=1 Tax=Cetobacterium sp. TaxID=2071632 RepID=UPI003F395D22